MTQEQHHSTAELREMAQRLADWNYWEDEDIPISMAGSVATALLTALDREAVKDGEIAELKENNFHWDGLQEANVCGFCGSQDQRTGGIKAHIRDNHMQEVGS